jgi:hypothetical protein
MKNYHFLEFNFLEWSEFTRPGLHMQSIPSSVLLTIFSSAVVDRSELFVDDFMVDLGATAVT